MTNNAEVLIKYCKSCSNHEKCDNMCIVGQVKEQAKKTDSSEMRRRSLKRLGISL